MEIYQIIHFIAIVETGSFTKGADRAAVSQSAVSVSVAKLEAEFDVQLLDRRHTPVIPTDAGERLLEVGKTILQLCTTLKGELETIARAYHCRPVKNRIDSTDYRIAWIDLRRRPPERPGKARFFRMSGLTKSVEMC